MRRLATAILIMSAAAILIMPGTALLIMPASAAGAGSPTLERIRHDGVLRCGSAIRPGLAFPAVDHTWHGLHVELCHAIAAVVLGDAAKVEFYGYALRPDFDRIRSGADDVAFLTGSELFANELFSAVLPGPAVFQETTQLMVWDSSDVHHVADLGGTMVCAEPGTGAERALQGYAAAHGWKVNFSGWMELEEMMDAFNVGRCPAVAGEVTALAALRLGSEQAGHPSRILDEKLSATPVMAATPVADPAWALIVDWTIGTVLGGGPAAAPLPIAGEWLGLDRGWQARATAGGSYAELVRRTLGDLSPLELPAGLNASWRDGGVTVPPSVE